MTPDFHILQQKWRKAVFSLGRHALHASSVYTGNGTDLALSCCRQGVGRQPCTHSIRLTRLPCWQPRQQWKPPEMWSRQQFRMLPRKQPRGTQLSSSLLCCSRHCSRCVLLSRRFLYCDHPHAEQTTGAPAVACTCSCGRSKLTLVVVSCT